MIKEQDKAIERCNKLIETEHSNWIGITNQKAIETVLNMLKEKEAEIQFQKDINKTEKDRHKQAEKSLKGHIEKKDKMIDLIIDFFYKLTQESPGTTIHYLEKNGFDTSKCNNCSPGNDCRKCFKQYFERKAKDGRL